MSLYYKMAQSIRGDRIADIPELFNQDNINTVEKIIANIASREILTVCVTYYFTLNNAYTPPTRSQLSKYDMAQLKIILYRLVLESSEEDLLLRISLGDIGHGNYGKMCTKIIDCCKKR